MIDTIQDVHRQRVIYGQRRMGKVAILNSRHSYVLHDFLRGQIFWHGERPDTFQHLRAKQLLEKLQANLD